MRRAMAAWALVSALFAWPVAGQDTGELGGYDALDIEAGYYVSDLSGRIESLSEGVKLTLLSKDPQKASLPITANKITFSYASDSGSKPSNILLEGKVVIEHSQATVHAEKAEWDFQKGILTFTGSPVLSNAQIQEVRAEKVVLDFETNHLEMFKMKAKEVDLNAAGPGESSGSSPLLSDRDVRDWPGLLDTLKKEAAQDTPSPGKQIVSVLDADTRTLITTLPTESLLKNKDKVLRQINNVLKSPKLYREDAWKGVKLDADIEEKAKASNLSEEERIATNRALLAAAYPDYLAGGA